MWRHCGKELTTELMIKGLVKPKFTVTSTGRFQKKVTVGLQWLMQCIFAVYNAVAQLQ